MKGYICSTVRGGKEEGLDVQLTPLVTITGTRKSTSDFLHFPCWMFVWTSEHLISCIIATKLARAVMLLPMVTETHTDSCRVLLSLSLGEAVW